MNSDTAEIPGPVLQNFQWSLTLPGSCCRWPGRGSAGSREEEPTKPHSIRVAEAHQGVAGGYQAPEASLAAAQDCLLRNSVVSWFNGQLEFGLTSLSTVSVARNSVSSSKFQRKGVPDQVPSLAAHARLDLSQASNPWPQLCLQFVVYVYVRIIVNHLGAASALPHLCWNRPRALSARCYCDTLTLAPVPTRQAYSVRTFGHHDSPVDLSALVPYLVTLQPPVFYKVPRYASITRPLCSADVNRPLEYRYHQPNASTTSITLEFVTALLSHPS
ncbi:uncharacterized protein CLUP02_02419 [Colletotrichum lupini]|uniref:Uncharacterized protein n=1 Tax=Colletotrichum lupini TaxID=145971 RepID=A0A9Q8SH07_9PEZI|nr:uncharacterized protein CLUP02_02419 [Colletotrichum lupini]UQC76953.1 hypothetical protein CLUP02_02419 [Colletotrichum lupini]